MIKQKRCQDTSIDVITIDGGAGTGKGTTRMLVAKDRQYHELDSGIFFRALGIKAQQFGIQTSNIRDLVALAHNLVIVTQGEDVLLDGRIQTALIRSEEAGKLAAVVAQIKKVRNALLHHQLAMRKWPGLVADGRDMGKIFLKAFRFFLKTDVEERARRRVAQFERMKIEANYGKILEEIKLRDIADENNPANQLKPHPKAHIIDNTTLTPEETAQVIIRRYLTLKSH